MSLNHELDVAVLTRYAEIKREQGSPATTHGGHVSQTHS